MKTCTNYLERSLIEKAYLEKAIADLENELRDKPPGTLRCYMNGKAQNWFVCDGRNRRYIPKSDRKLAETLVAKEYIIRQKVMLEKQLSVVSAAVSAYNDIKDGREELLQSSLYAPLLQPFFDEISKRESNWSKAAYAKNPNYPERCNITTSAGIRVRSKSEAMIAGALFDKHIPFRYEQALQVGKTIYYPDFTIRLPKTGQIMYWEHFGMMDDERYRAHAWKKLDTYISFGILPGRDLVVTMEAADSPLSYSEIEGRIQSCLLLE